MKICICTTPIRPTPSGFPPFGSMAIIQSLKSIGLNPLFYHLDYFRYSEEQIKNYFYENQFDVVGISAVVSTAYKYTKNLVNIIKTTNNKTIVVVGGSLTASAKVLHLKCNIDYCVIGDGEIIIRELIKCYKENNLSDENLIKIKGITFYNKDNNFTFTGFAKPPSPEEIKNPDFNILKNVGCLDYYMTDRPPWMDDYGINYKHDNKKTVTFISSKGCVARCTFCHRNEKGYRVLPQSSTSMHLEDLVRNYNVGWLSIGDENFGSNKQATKIFLEQLRKLNLKWRAGGVRANTVDLETLKLWKDSGCTQVIYGIESGSPTMLSVMEKKITLEQNINALKLTYEADLPTVVQLVIGMPGENDITIDETIDFLLKTMPFYSDCFRNRLNLFLSINYAQSLPGTPLYEYARKEKYISRNLDEEEQYLLLISDTDAYAEDHFINYTKQPLLKVLSWRYKIQFSIFKYHAKHNLRIESTLFEKTISFFAILLKLLGKFFKIKILLNTPIEKKFSEFFEVTSTDGYFNLRGSSHTLAYLIPWNKYTYPFLVFFIALRSSKGFNKKFFKLIGEHLIFSLKLKKLDLPKKTLRKLDIGQATDEDILLRMGR